MQAEIAIYFVNQLRTARANALRDAEAYHDIVVALEQLGSLLTEGKAKRTLGMGAYSPKINELADRTALAHDIPDQFPTLHSAYAELYESVRTARNDAVHQGAYARHLTAHAIQLALILEDALMAGLSRVVHYMVRDPVCAADWQPVSFVRQQMLLNSFSYLPLHLEMEGQSGWHLLSDSAVARYLRAASSSQDRRALLAQTVAQAVTDGSLKLDPATLVQVAADISEVLERFRGQPLLVIDEHQRLVGIVTAFDLL